MNDLQARCGICRQPMRSLEDGILADAREMPDGWMLVHAPCFHKQDMGIYFIALHRILEPGDPFRVPEAGPVNSLAGWVYQLAGKHWFRKEHIDGLYAAHAEARRLAGDYPAGPDLRKPENRHLRAI